MDRTMFPRTVVEIDLVLDLCDKQRYDLLAAVMSFCCRQTRSLVPCRDFKTMRVWCGVTPQWWARWGVQVVPLIPPLGGGAYGFMEIEAAWESHQKWADTNRIKGMKSGVARRIKKLRKPVKAVEPGNRTQCSTGDEQTQPQSQSHSPALATLYPKIGTSLAPGSLGGTPEPVPPVAGSLPLPQPPQAENGGEKLTALLNSIVEQNCREKRKNAETLRRHRRSFWHAWKLSTRSGRPRRWPERSTTVLPTKAKVTRAECPQCSNKLELVDYGLGNRELWCRKCQARWSTTRAEREWLQIHRSKLTVRESLGKRRPSSMAKMPVAAARTMPA